MKTILKGKIMNDTALKIRNLKDNQQDYEFYPTTDEIINCVRKDIFNIHNTSNGGWQDRDRGLDFDSRGRDNTAVQYIDSLLDIGAGDGRVLDGIAKELNKTRVNIKTRYGIEKATVQADDLIKRDVALIGRDYFETVLIDSKFTVVFSNPPYSQYKEWCIKLAKEVNALFIYLVIPQRWKLDNDLKALFESVGETSVIGSFDFTEGDREARAKVDVVKIIPNEKNDTFRSWVEDNIGLFTENEPVDLEGSGEEEEDKDEVRKHNKDTVAVMLENYKDDMQNLLVTFGSLGSVDWSLISQLGVTKEDVIGKIRQDIIDLKYKYWRQTFDHMKAITSRLTYNKRQNILSEIKWFEKLDFNENNIKTIIVWIIKNFNNYTKGQMIEVYDKITNFNTVRAYKSNDKWLDDGWRCTKVKPVKYSLDYRIVVHIGYELYRSHYSDNVQPGNPIEDLAVVARSLGFDNWGVQGFERGVAHECQMKGSPDVLFEYKIYKNNNVHFKLNKDFLRVLNVEVGKARGWLKKPADVQEEFDLSPEEAEKFFIKENLSLIASNDLLLLGA